VVHICSVALAAVLALLGASACVRAPEHGADAGTSSDGHAATGSGGAALGSGGAGSSAGQTGTGGGNNASGGTTGTGGAIPTGGHTATGGSGNVIGGAGGHLATGGANATSGAGGRVATGGTSASGGANGTGGRGTGGGAFGGTIGPGNVYSQCRFHFGTTEGIATNNAAMIQQLDFFTPGWMGQADTFNMKALCDVAKAGAKFGNQVPVIVAYVAAFYAKRHDNLKDCNAAGSQQDLCVVGAAYIQQNLAAIVSVYESYAQGFAGCYGTTRPIIFLIEPDFYQYTGTGQTQPWSAALAGQIMGQFVGAIRKHMPNAVFSMDISPWVAPNNGSDHGKSWFSNFDLSLFTFVNTSGGGTEAANTRIRSSNMMTWAGVSQATGKPIMADTGYGVSGSSAGPDANWDNATNINARIDDGVVSISQYNPAAGWGSTITGVRGQLKTPRFCP
jgi:hypothetical protein